MFAPPKTYNEMLRRLHWSTAILTFIYTAVLTLFGYFPELHPAKDMVPPIAVAGNRELLPWALAAFGVIPVVSAIAAYVVSRFFEVHNLLAKAIQLRFVWDKYNIVKPLRDRAGSDMPLDRSNVKRVMNEFYYSAVKKIDQHYVELFWRYALPFWALFEHLLVVAVSLLILALLKAPHISWIAGYLFLVLAVSILHYFFIVTKKTQDQVAQIPTDDIKSYFKRSQLIARL